MIFLRLHVPAGVFLAWLLIMTAAATSLVSCTQRETDIGRGAITDLPDQVFHVYSDSAVRGVAFEPQLGNGAGQSLQIGRAAGFDASFGIRFWPSQVLPDSARVDSMELVLRRASIWPVIGAPELGIRLREITENWSESLVTDSLFLARSGYPVIDFLRITSSDTMLSFRIPDSLARRWVSSDTATHGLFFEPASSGTLIDFYSSEAASGFRARLKVWGVQWLLSDGVWRDTTLSLEIPNTDPPNNNHVQDVYVAWDSSSVGAGRFAVSWGAPVRYGLYFSIDSILANPSLTVARAELRVYADTLDAGNLNLAPGTNPLFTHGAMRDTVWFAYPDSARGGDYSRTSAAISAEGYYGFDASSLVANWVFQPERNTGVQVLATDETGTLGRQIFHGPQSEVASKRPQLLIWLVESR